MEKEDFKRINQALIKQNNELVKQNDHIRKQMQELETYILENIHSIKRNSIAIIILGIAFFIQQILIRIG